MATGLRSRALANTKAALYLAPALAVVALVFVYPIYKTIHNSLLEAMLGGTNAGATRFVGFRNYGFLFRDSLFWDSIKHNLLLFATCVPLLLGLSVILSVLLYQGMRGWKVYRTVVFMPYVMPIVVVGVAFGFMFQYSGVINGILGSLGLGGLKVDWLARGVPAFFVLVVMIVWKELGFGVVIMLARLLSVDASLVEAGQLDGCNWWQLVFRVLVPQMRDVISFYAVLATITVFTWLFNYVFVLTRGGPGTTTYVLELYVYNQAFKYQNRGLSSAVAALIIVAVLLVTFAPDMRRAFDRGNG